MVLLVEYLYKIKYKFDLYFILYVIIRCVRYRSVEWEYKIFRRWYRRIFLWIWVGEKKEKDLKSKNIKEKIYFFDYSDINNVYLGKILVRGWDLNCIVEKMLEVYKIEKDFMFKILYLY